MLNSDRCQWPMGAKCAVMVTFDFDAETMWMSEDKTAHLKPTILSQGGYGAKVGIYALLELLRSRDIPASFYVPGWTAENHTAAVEAILKDGHEVGHHGHLHKWIDPENPAMEIEEMERGLDALKRSVGVVPKGYRSPAATSSQQTISLVHKYGFLYDSSFLDDVYPYRHVLADGKPGPIELPFFWNLDDSALSLYLIDVQSTIQTSAQIFELWKEEFDTYRDCGALINITLHPQISGRPNRLKLLERFIDYMRGHDDVWFATGEEIAKSWQENNETISAAAQKPF